MPRSRLTSLDSTLRGAPAGLALLAIAAFLAWPAHGVPLGSAVSQGTVSCGVRNDQGNAPTTLSFGPTTAQIVSGACDVLGQFGNPGTETVSQAVAAVNTVHSAAPVADVQVSLARLVGLQSAAGSGASGTASISYEVAFTQTGMPPALGLIPILVASDWSIGLTYDPQQFGRADGSVKAQVLQQGLFLASDQVLLSSFGGDLPGIEEGTFQSSLLVEPDVPIAVVIESSCSLASGPRNPGEEWGCQAVIDPVFMFDQASFDAQMGAASFQLSDFYQIEISANLPEPGSQALLASGALALLWSARRRRSSRLARDLSCARAGATFRGSPN